MPTYGTVKEYEEAIHTLKELLARGRDQTKALELAIEVLDAEIRWSRGEW